MSAEPGARIDLASKLLGGGRFQRIRSCDKKFYATLTAESAKKRSFVIPITHSAERLRNIRLP
jgi:hypothetical protein